MSSFVQIVIQKAANNQKDNNSKDNNSKNTKIKDNNNNSKNTDIKDNNNSDQSGCYIQPLKKVQNRKQKKERVVTVRKLTKQQQYEHFSNKQGQGKIDRDLNRPLIGKGSSRPIRASNLISQILDHQIYKQKNLNPQFLRIKNNILLIMLCLSTFGIYILFQDFLDVMLLAFIGGVGYQQIRERFTKFWESGQPFFQKQMNILLRILQIIGCLLGIALIPWIRILISDPTDIINHIQVTDIINTFSLRSNIAVSIVQIILFLKVLHLILAPKIFPIIAEYAPRGRSFCSNLFGILFFLTSLTVIIFLPIVFFKQISFGGFWVQSRVEEHLGCQIISYSSHNNSQLPFCTQMFFKNNTLFEETFKQFRTQTSEIQECMAYISGLQNDYVGYEIFHYQQVACTWFLIIQKASNYFAPDSDAFTTGTTFFKTVFGKIANILMSFSNIIFSLTTFATIFFITVHYFNSKASMIQQIFYGQRKQLLGQITNLIQATIFIVMEHFFMSIFLLEMFDFSYFNMIISTFLSSMAFVPFFRPWLGAAFFSLIRSIFIGNYIANLLFVLIYYYVSQRIFSSRLNKMKLHQIITNLSVLFGIYQFGIAGIFYGPIILILFKSVHRQLLRNQVYNSQDLLEEQNRTKNI